MKVEAAEQLPFFTVGHSTRTVEELKTLLIASGVDCLVDVRTMPRSRANPQFNEDILPGSLAPEVHYHHIAALGGLRSRTFPPGQSPNSFWRNSSFRNYADYALTSEFKSGLGELLEIGQRSRCAIMCAETVWWRCHRRIIADYLLAGGRQVFHILGPGRTDEALLTPEAMVEARGLVYASPQPGARDSD